MKKPLMIDLYCGLGGWSEGFIAEGYECVGFDIERHKYGEQCYPGQLVLQDVSTIHGSQFKDAACIMASPPCQNYSYLAMPWSRSTNPNNSKAAKALRRKWETEGPDNRLFDACFRIQREAIEATDTGTCACCGHYKFVHDRQHGCSDTRVKDYWICNCERYRPSHRYIPMIVENVRGAQPWVGKRDIPLEEWLKLSDAGKTKLGRSACNFGSFHLWGDVPALMPINSKRGSKVPGFRFDGSGGSFQTAAVERTGQKSNPDGTNRPKGSWFTIADSSQRDRREVAGEKGGGGSWFAVANNTNGHSKNPVHAIAGQKVPAYSDPRRNGGKGVHLTSPHENSKGLKIGGDWFSDPNSTCMKHGSRSQARKAASAQIAKIPLPLSTYLAQVFKPRL